MPLAKEQIQKIENTIKVSLRKKFQTYNPETKNMPFHYCLLGRDRMALFSFIHSLNTTFGTSIQTVRVPRFCGILPQNGQAANGIIFL